VAFSFSTRRLEAIPVSIARLIDALNDAIVINRQVEMTLKSNQNGLLIFCLVQKIGEPGF
jgi:hypothetical protein